MAEILDLKENFANVPLGSTPTLGTTIFDVISGTAPTVAITDPYDATKKMLEITASAAVRSLNANFNPVTNFWLRFDIDYVTAFNPIVGIVNVYDTSAQANKVLDIRASLNARSLQLRNVNSIAYTTPVFAPNEKYRVYLHATTDASKLVRLLVYRGPTLTELFADSGDIAGTTTAPSIGHTRFGVFTSSTGSWRLGDIRGDDAVMPIDPPSETIDVVADNATPETGDTVVLTATKTGTATLGITQTAGPAVTLTPNGDTWSFEMPGTITAGVPVSTTVTFNVTYGGATDTVSVTAGPHHRWRRMDDNSRKPVTRKRYSP